MSLSVYFTTVHINGTHLVEEAILVTAGSIATLAINLDSDRLGSYKACRSRKD
jgi:hypothetical protein